MKLHYLNVYWAGPDWSVGTHSLRPYVAAGRPGVANIYWLAAAPYPAITVDAAVRKALCALRVSYQCHPLERWASTGSLALFADTLKGIPLPDDAVWLREACAQLQPRTPTKEIQ